MSRKQRVYSLGYEGIDLEQYVRLLKLNEVRVVADVRLTAWSYKKGFSKGQLAERLEAEGIRYVHLKSAGNPAENRKQGFAQLEVIERYKQHLDENPGCLEELSDLISNSEGSVCLLCFERRPHDCHRKVLLDRLVITQPELEPLHIAT